MLERGSDNGTKVRQMAAQASEHAYTKIISRGVTIILLPAIGLIIAYFLSDMKEDRARAISSIEKVSTDVGKVAVSVQQVAVEVVRVVQKVQNMEDGAAVHKALDVRSFKSVWERYGDMHDDQAAIRERLSRIEGEQEAERRSARWRRDSE